MSLARIRPVALNAALLGVTLCCCVAPAGAQPGGGGTPLQASPPVTGAPAAPANGASSPNANATAPADDIRDIRGPKPVTSPWFLWFLIGGGVLAALLGYLAWKWFKRRRKEPATPDFEVALARLEAARALMQPGRARDFSIEVSGVVREYIERRFKVMAAHRTTHEFLHDLVLSANPGLAAHRDLLGDFLQSCDLAKFGGWNLQIDQMTTMLESARRFIQSVSSAEAGDSQAGATAKDGTPADPAVRSDSGKPHVSLPST